MADMAGFGARGRSRKAGGGNLPEEGQAGGGQYAAQEPQDAGASASSDPAVSPSEKRSALQERQAREIHRSAEARRMLESWQAQHAERASRAKKAKSPAQNAGSPDLADGKGKNERPEEDFLKSRLPERMHAQDKQAREIQGNAYQSQEEGQDPAKRRKKREGKWWQTRYQELPREKDADPRSLPGSRKKKSGKKLQGAWLELESEQERSGRRKRAGRGGVPGLVLLPFFLLLALFAAGIAYIYIQKTMPSQKKADLSSYFDVAGDNVQVYLNDEKQYNEKGYLVIGRQSEGHVFLPYDWVSEKLNRRFYWAEDLGAFLYSLPTETIRTNAGDLLQDGSHAFFQEGKNLFLSADWIQQYTDMRFLAFPDEEHKRIFIYYGQDQAEEQLATLRGKEALRLEPDKKSDVLTELPKGAEVHILESGEEWTEARSGDGFLGYLRTEKLEEIRTEHPDNAYTAPVYSYLRRTDGSKIELGFHQVTVQAANDSLDNLMSATGGVMNVAAPTWFVINDDNGGFQQFCSKDYVDKAHAADCEVWPTVNNFDAGNVNEEVFLRDTALRAELIDGLLSAAGEYGFDGINIDFEQIQSSVGNDYMQFMRELSIACRNAGIVLSVDSYVPYGYNSHYDLEELGLFCDYVLIMCYDEHYAGSEEAGSVASISYVDRGIQETLSMVPKEGILIALPFYTRLWTTQDGKLSSQALGISAATDWVQEHGLTLSWDAESGQNYGALDEDGAHREIWMEDAESIRLKMSHVISADVAGAAAWKLGFEPSGFWVNMLWQQ